MPPDLALPKSLSETRELYDYTIVGEDLSKYVAKAEEIDNI
jgi:hypothetical protein